MSRNPQFYRNAAPPQVKGRRVNLIIVKVVRNVLISIGIDACTTRNIALTAVFLTPETGNQVDLSILKFGNPVAGQP